MGWARSTQRLLVSAIAAGIAVQFFLAGAGAFHAAGYGAHRALGWALLVAGGVAFVVSLAAVRLVGHSGVLLLVFALQAGLGVLGADTQAWFGALHAVNALAVMGAAGTLARRAWAAA